MTARLHFIHSFPGESMHMIKSVRTVSLLLLAALIASLLTSCSKTPSDTEAFKALANSKGYVIYDVSDQYINAPQMRAVTIVAPADKSFQIEFYQITDLESTREIFRAMGKEMENSIGTSWKGSVSNGANYANRYISTDCKYMYLSYIGNTILYVPPVYIGENDDLLDTIKEFVSEFNY